MGASFSLIPTVSIFCSCFFLSLFELAGSSLCSRLLPIHCIVGNDDVAKSPHWSKLPVCCMPNRPIYLRLTSFVMQLFGRRGFCRKKMFVPKVCIRDLDKFILISLFELFFCYCISCLKNTKHIKSVQRWPENNHRCPFNKEFRVGIHKTSYANL